LAAPAPQLRAGWSDLPRLTAAEVAEEGAAVVVAAAEPLGPTSLK
jgi:hypothetical protein